MEIRLIVPNCNRSISPLVAYGPTIARIAGGFTASQATGGWVDDADVLIVEPVTVFDCSTAMNGVDRASGGIVDAFRHLAAKIAAELKQTCVYLRIDCDVEYIRPE
jgi:hypothetical protein